MDSAALARLHVGVISREPASLAAFEAAVRPIALALVIQRGLDMSDAEEIWDDSFLAAIERAPAIEPLGLGLRRFVLHLVHAAAVDRVRRAVRRAEVPLDDVGEALDAAALRPQSGSSLSDATLAALRRCLGAASEIYRLTMEMVSRGLTSKEIAAVLGKSVDGIEKLRQRARAWFARCMEGVI